MDNRHNWNYRKLFNLVESGHLTAEDFPRGVYDIARAVGHQRQDYLRNIETVADIQQHVRELLDTASLATQHVRGRMTKQKPRKDGTPLEDALWAVYSTYFAELNETENLTRRNHTVRVPRRYIYVITIAQLAHEYKSDQGDFIDAFKVPTEKKFGHFVNDMGMPFTSFKIKNGEGEYESHRGWNRFTFRNKNSAQALILRYHQACTELGTFGDKFIPAPPIGHSVARSYDFR